MTDRAQSQPGSAAMDDVRRMIEKDKDGGKMLRNRAASYDPLTRTYLKVLGTEQVPVGPLPK